MKSQPPNPNGLSTGGEVGIDQLGAGTYRPIYQPQNAQNSQKKFGVFSVFGGFFLSIFN